MEAFPAHRGHRKGQRKIGLTQTAARKTFRHTVQYAPVLSEWIGLGPYGRVEFEWIDPEMAPPMQAWPPRQVLEPLVAAFCNAIGTKRTLPSLRSKSA